MGEARLAVFHYGAEPVADGDIKRLLGVFNAEVHLVTETTLPALLFPPIFGKYRLAIHSAVPVSARRFLVLHEIGHILGGEAEEPTRLIHTDPLPESELVCDLFALLGIIDPVHEQEGPEWLEHQIRQAVPLDDKGWQVHRIPRLARKLSAVRQLVYDRLDS